MSLASLGEDARGLLKSVGVDNVDEEKAKSALEAGLEGVEKVGEILTALKGGDSEKAERLLSEWSDVQETLDAISGVEGAIEDADAAVQLKQVLSVAATVLKFSLAAAAVL